LAKSIYIVLKEKTFIDLRSKLVLYLLASQSADPGSYYLAVDIAALDSLDLSSCTLHKQTRVRAYVAIRHALEDAYMYRMPEANA
jgi:hypothetical protein